MVQHQFELPLGTSRCERCECLRSDCEMVRLIWIFPRVYPNYHETPEPLEEIVCEECSMTAHEDAVDFRGKLEMERLDDYEAPKGRAK